MESDELESDDGGVAVAAVEGDAVVVTEDGDAVVVTEDGDAVDLADGDAVGKGAAAGVERPDHRPLDAMVREAADCGPSSAIAASPPRPTTRAPAAASTASEWIALVAMATTSWCGRRN
ncbi:hypothetical protein [Pedococcus cremeus]|uniref:hypothetical protein n=1 Tax=Pedococcus cremeus TaxID=587636 RepID=UPI001C42FC25|nr:hypothetical protein [Pedococcus cremeus]